MDEEIAAIVREFGWYGASINDHDPPFLYSIGLLQTYTHPELIVFGLDSDNAHNLFTLIIDGIRSGESFSKPDVKTISAGEEHYRVGFRPVHPTQHPLYLGFAMGFARSIRQELQAVQAFWPDRNGKFPFDVGCDLEVYGLQPRLDIPLTPSEIRRFERRWE